MIINSEQLQIFIAESSPSFNLLILHITYTLILVNAVKILQELLLLSVFTILYQKDLN
jgi:hypothetical protein